MSGKNGYGSHTWDDGSHYLGYWKDGSFHGVGIHETEQGDVYVGNHVHGEREGRGAFYFKNGDIYQGNFVDNLRHGFGSFWAANGDKYRGEWKNDSKHGKGLFFIAQNGTVYENEWEDGHATGQGKFLTKEGDLYEGGLFKGLRHGNGVFTWSDGQRIEGSWENGIRDDDTVNDLPNEVPTWSPPKDFIDSKPLPRSEFEPVPPSDTHSHIKEEHEPDFHHPSDHHPTPKPETKSQKTSSEIFGDEIDGPTEYEEIEKAKAEFADGKNSSSGHAGQKFTLNLEVEGLNKKIEAPLYLEGELVGYADIEDKGDGNNCLTFSPERPGDYTMVIIINGEEVSEAEFHVKPW